MKFLVVGAGGQGAPCASILSKDPEVSKIVLADINEELLGKVSEKIGSDKLTTKRVDAGNVEDLKKAAKGVDAIINLTLCRFNKNIMRAAVDSGAHYVDTAFLDPVWRQLRENKPLELEEEFKDAGLTAVLVCGGSAGLTNVLTRHICDNLDRVDRISVILGGKDIKESEKVIKTWEPGWSPEIAFEDFASDVDIFEEGKFRTYPPLSGMESYIFPDPVGPVLVSWHRHEETMTLPRFLHKDVKFVEFKYPVNKIVESFIKMGFASDEPIDVKGVKVAPKDVLMSMVRRPVNRFLTEDENTAVAPSSYRGFQIIEVEGEMDGEEVEGKVVVVHTVRSAEEKLEMFRRLGTLKVGVAAPAIVGAKMCLKGETESGVIAPECLDPTRFLEEMSKLGVPVSFEETLTKKFSF